MSDLEKASDVSEERDDDAGALYVLGTRYATGRDVDQDLIAAHKWFNLAAMMGHEEARICRAELAHEMSTADVAEAQRQARAWLWSRANAKPAEETNTEPATPFSRSAKPVPASQDNLQTSRSLCA